MIWIFYIIPMGLKAWVAGIHHWGKQGDCQFTLLILFLLLTWWRLKPGRCLNIKISSYQSRNSHYKDITTVSSLKWKYLCLERRSLYYEWAQDSTGMTLSWLASNIPDTEQERLNKSLQWCHNERDGVSNHQPHDCLLNRLFRRRSKKISKLRVTGLCEGNSPVTVEFPAQRASNAENVFIWWRHHDKWDHETHNCIITSPGKAS